MRLTLRNERSIVSKTKWHDQDFPLDGTKGKKAGQDQTA